MSGRLLEIFGRAIAADTAELIWHWLDSVLQHQHITDAEPHILEQVLKHVAARRLGPAEQTLRAYLTRRPGCVYGRLAAAAVCLQESKLHDAIEQLTSVYSRQPSNTMALYALGHCYERLEKQAQASEFYQDCIKFKSYLELPRQRLAAIHLVNGRLEKAAGQYEMLKTEYPDDLDTLVTLGYLYVACGRYPEALNAFNQAILMQPDNFHPAEEIDPLLNEGMLDEALQRLDQLEQQYGESPAIALKRAEVLACLGLNTEAVAQYQHALQRRSDLLEARIKLATLYVSMNWNRLAAKQLIHAVEANDRIVDAYAGLALAHHNAGHHEDALSALALASAIQPNTFLIFAEAAALQFAVDLAEAGHADDHLDTHVLLPAVIAAHQQQLAANPQNPDLCYRLGLLLANAGQFAEAADAFRTVLQTNPTHSRARTKLAVCLFETNHHDQAVQQLIEPACPDARTLELHYKTALLYCDRVRFACSLINLESCLEQSLANLDTTVNISVVLQNLGLLDRADAMWENLCHTAEQAVRSQ